MPTPAIRVDLLKTTKTDTGACQFSFGPVGFPPDELVIFAIDRPDPQADFELPEPIPTLITLTVGLNPGDPPGDYIVIFRGPQNTAQYVIHWTGVCP
jgi:hypothetical protein